MTGVTNLGAELGPKRLEFLHELFPTATAIAVLDNPANPALTEPFLRGLAAGRPCPRRCSSMS